jgi:hypothetical protein
LGCGQFERYGVSADASNAPYVTYPEPGYTIGSSCTAINHCLNVRITTSAIRMVDFTLQLYPMYNQNPIGIPYRVDVSLCANYATLTVGSNPA